MAPEGRGIIMLGAPRSGTTLLRRLLEGLAYAGFDESEVLGERWDPEMTVQSLQSHRNLGLGDWKTYGRKTIDRSSVGRWTTLSPDTVSRLGAICNPTLEMCGYPQVDIAAERSPEEIRRPSEIGMRFQGIGNEPSRPTPRES